MKRDKAAPTLCLVAGVLAAGVMYHFVARDATMTSVLEWLPVFVAFVVGAVATHILHVMLTHK